MFVLGTIWYTIAHNHTEKNKCIIKDMIRRSITYKSKKNFQISN